MALPLLVGSHEVEVTPRLSGFNASAWAGQGRVLVAAYNGRAEPREAKIEVAAAAPGQATSLSLDSMANPVRPGPSAAGRGSLVLTVRLAPGEALLWGNWDWRQ